MPLFQVFSAFFSSPNKRQTGKPVTMQEDSLANFLVTNSIKSVEKGYQIENLYPIIVSTHKRYQVSLLYLALSLEGADSFRPYISGTALPSPFSTAKSL